MNGWIDRCIIDGWMNGWMDEWMEGQTDGWIREASIQMSLYLECVEVSQVQALDSVHGALPAVLPALSRLHLQCVVILDLFQLLFK